MKMVYEYKHRLPSVRYAVSAQVAGEALEEMRVRHGGGLSPSSIVDESRPADAILHECFEWDDSVGGERWREQQARNLLGSIVVRLEGQPRVEEPVRAFVNLSAAEKPGYLHLATVLSDEGLRLQMLTKALREAEAWARRYRAFAELQPIVEAIEEAVGVAQ